MYSKLIDIQLDEIIILKFDIKLDIHLNVQLGRSMRWPIIDIKMGDI